MMNQDFQYLLKAFWHADGEEVVTRIAEMKRETKPSFVLWEHRTISYSTVGGLVEYRITSHLKGCSPELFVSGRTIQEVYDNFESRAKHLGEEMPVWWKE
jgi:hypothetical protein